MDASDYRENVNRALYVLGKIDQDPVYRLTPEINRLRLSGAEPVTVYIDSPGGIVYYAEVIRRLLKLPDAAGEKRQVVTVVTNFAASAAADFLALGDYAIAYADSQIVYHGSRENTVPELTVEAATTLASSLRQSNEFFAARLARRAFTRFVLRITQLKEEFDSFRNDAYPLYAGESFTRLIMALPIREGNQRLLSESIERRNKIRDLTISVGTHLSDFKDLEGRSESEIESEMLKAILNHKVKGHQKEDWLLSGTGLSEVVADFELLNDFHYGSQSQALARLAKIYGDFLLSDTEKAEYSSLDPAENKEDWVKKKSEPKLKNLWYFTVSLCRILQSADFELSPEEAYWLGLVDEVPGSNLPNLREVYERKHVPERENSTVHSPGVLAL